MKVPAILLRGPWDSAWPTPASLYLLLQWSYAVIAVGSSRALCEGVGEMLLPDTESQHLFGGISQVLILLCHPAHTTSAWKNSHWWWFTWCIIPWKYYVQKSPWESLGDNIFFSSCTLPYINWNFNSMKGYSKNKLTYWHKMWRSDSSKNSNGTWYMTKMKQKCTQPTLRQRAQRTVTYFLKSITGKDVILFICVLAFPYKNQLLWNPLIKKQSLW